MNGRRSWHMASALLGGLVWVGTLAAAPKIGAAIGTIEQLFLLAPLAIVPLGLLLIDPQASDRISDKLGPWLRLAAGRLQPIAALMVVGSFCVEPGPLAAALVLPWLAVAGLAALSGVRGLLLRGFSDLKQACNNVGLCYLAIGAGWLTVSRFGGGLLGFEEPIVLLTATHFHFTGFAAAILAGQVGRMFRASPDSRRLVRLATIGVLGGPPLIAVGFVASPLIKVIGVVWLAISLAGVAALELAAVPRLRHRAARVLLAVSGLSIVAGMMLAGIYSIGEFTGHLWLSIPHMARTHGLINAFGFTLCGLLAWIVEDGP